MTDDPARPDHERIWLEPSCCADPCEGRHWAQDDAWGDDCDAGARATEYVRADLVAALRAADFAAGAEAMREMAARVPGDAAKAKDRAGWTGVVSHAAHEYARHIRALPLPPLPGQPQGGAGDE